MWTMKDGDKKCQQIFNNAEWVREQAEKYIGTGYGGGGRR